MSEERPEFLAERSISLLHTTRVPLYLHTPYSAKESVPTFLLLPPGPCTKDQTKEGKLSQNSDAAM